MTLLPTINSPLEIYTPLVEILEELEKRRNDKILAQKVKDFFVTTPGFIGNEDSRYAFFSRPFITPNTELRYFLDIIPLFNLSPLFLEYPSKFVLRNREKRSLAELCFMEDFAVNPRANFECERIVNFKEWEGKDLLEVQTMWGESLHDFHQDLFCYAFPELKDRVIDFSEWFNVARRENGFYYLKYLALFIQNGILFENFLSNDPDEINFFKEKVAPSFEKATEIFGVKPLIFPLLPIRDEKSPVWLSYPISTRDSVAMMKKPEPLIIELAV